MINIIGVQLDMGASKKGVNMGPQAIRFAGLHDMLQAAAISYSDEGDLLPKESGRTLPNMHYYELINDINGKLFRVVTDSLKRNMIPLVLGGDHSVAAGSIAAVSSFYGSIGVIWVDAHADFNDEHSTITGNVHGMPLSAVCGQGPDIIVDFGVPVTTVNPKNVVIVGLRDVDENEWPRLKAAGVTVYTMDAVRNLGIEYVMEQAIVIASEGTKGIHVSFDIDSLDPFEAPGSGTPVPGGLSTEEAHKLAKVLAKSKKLLSIDMVEVNPVLDDGVKTARLACELITELLK